MKEPKIHHIRCSLHSYTFNVKAIKEWVESNCGDNVLNLYAGYNKLNVPNEVRNDLDPDAPVDYHLDALEFLNLWIGDKFDTIVLDPPYAERKSMEYYGGRKASPFQMVKESLKTVLKPKGNVVTLGYHSVVMGKKHNFNVESIALFSHGGAIHDTIGTSERWLE